MTCVVALTDGENLLFAADSAGTNLEAGEIFTFNNEKIFRCGPWLVGHTHSYRLGHLLRWRVDWPEPPADPAQLDSFVAIQLIDAIKLALRKASEEFGRDEQLRTVVVVGIAGRIYGISNDFSLICPQLPFVAIGHGRHYAYGSFYTLRNSGLSLRALAQAALEAAEYFDTTVRGPFLFLGDPPSD